MAWIMIGREMPASRFELRQKLIEIVNVPRPFDLRQHDDVELVADGRDDLQQIVERPGAVERVDAGPEAGVAEIVRGGHFDEAAPRSFFGVGGNGVFQIAEHHIDLAGDVGGTAARIFSMCGGMKWIIRSSRTGRVADGGGAPIASGAKNFRGVFVHPIEPSPRSVRRIVLPGRNDARTARSDIKAQRGDQQT